MILPPFFGFASQYDEKDIRQAIITYLSFDSATFTDPIGNANVTYVSTDIFTYTRPLPYAYLTYLSTDILSLSNPSKIASVTYESADVCTYDPPPAAPEMTIFLSGLAEDSSVELSWSTPYDNRCSITNYILEYTDCFISYMVDELQYNITLESSDLLILENYRDNCNYQEFNKSRLLLQNLDRLSTNLSNLLITEQSSGVGLVNFALVDELSNGQDYIFRVAAVNCAGTGEFGYSDIFTPLGPIYSYCDIIAFLKPDSTIDIYASLSDYSCREKLVNHIAGVSVSSVSEFGPGSLYFDGLFDVGRTPSTYSHLQIDHQNFTTLDNWSLIDDFTIELWIRPNNFPVYSNQTLASCYYQNNYDTFENYQNRYWKLYLYGNSVVFYMYNENFDFIFDEDWWQQLTLSANNLTLPTDTFTHIAVCRFQNYIRLYINGIKYDRQYFDKNIIIPPENNSYCIIAANQTDSYLYSDQFNTGRGSVNEPFSGHIDDIILSKAAKYSKNFVPQQYAEPADCQDCGSYISAASFIGVEDDFIP